MYTTIGTQKLHFDFQVGWSLLRVEHLSAAEARAGDPQLQSSPSVFMNEPRRSQGVLYDHAYVVDAVTCPKRLSVGYGRLKMKTPHLGNLQQGAPENTHTPT
jgi:hypothetical protein